MIELRERIANFDHERVVTAVGTRSGLIITVALHSSVLGPALGGCRLWAYPTWLDSVEDALRLSSAMTLKNAAAGLDAGGGKSVIRVASGDVLDPDRRTAALLDLGDQVELFAGLYRTAEDVGTTADDMAVVATRTGHVVGLPSESGGSGEPAGPTARGVLASIRTTLQVLYGSPSFDGRSFVVSGLGQVGTKLATSLAEGGGRLTVSDINDSKRSLAESLNAKWVAPEQALLCPADVLVPSGIGGVLTDEVIEGLESRAIVGPANNPLAARSGAMRLQERGVLYAPDFIVNAGGVIYLTLADEGVTSDEIDARIDGVGSTLARVYSSAATTGLTPLEAAESLALERIDSARSAIPSNERSA